MNEFDQFMKHKLKVRHYARYTDDFIVVSDGRRYLEDLIECAGIFLRDRLNLSIHPEKVEILKHEHGVDFLGYVMFAHHKQMRKRTWKRIVRKLKEKIVEHKSGLLTKESLDQTVQSYLGTLSHADEYQKSQDLKNMCWFLMGK